jgi:hypothetical protein
MGAAQPVPSAGCYQAQTQAEGLRNRVPSVRRDNKTFPHSSKHSRIKVTESRVMCLDLQDCPSQRYGLGRSGYGLAKKLIWEHAHEQLMASVRRRAARRSTLFSHARGLWLPCSGRRDNSTHSRDTRSLAIWNVTEVARGNVRASSHGNDGSDLGAKIVYTGCRSTPAGRLIRVQKLWTNRLVGIGTHQNEEEARCTWVIRVAVRVV